MRQLILGAVLVVLSIGLSRANPPALTAGVWQGFLAKADTSEVQLVSLTVTDAEWDHGLFRFSGLLDWSRLGDSDTNYRYQTEPVQLPRGTVEDGVTRISFSAARTTFSGRVLATEPLTVEGVWHEGDVQGLFVLVPRQDFPIELRRWFP
ncbi:MAG: hypothetical protein KDA27_17320 [Candidatus Eisenbacteria bacterium]|uniref:Uncharacterized protein n=1 Tax=Eiseniibacteriota bacterium TaxID=2212470 RepID=A0A956NEN1_UNCEI|nr:hypothetical protein [Candidatus Eisenbacteria bacterium]